jgi:hypothetical protein
MEEGWDRLNVERTIQLSQGNLKLKPLPAESPAPAATKGARAKAAKPAAKTASPAKAPAKRRTAPKGRG